MARRRPRFELHEVEHGLVDEDAGMNERARPHGAYAQRRLRWRILGDDRATTTRHRYRDRDRAHRKSV